MKKFLSILAAILVTAAIASAETSGGEALLESIYRKCGDQRR